MAGRKGAGRPDAFDRLKDLAGQDLGAENENKAPGAAGGDSSEETGVLAGDPQKVPVAAPAGGAPDAPAGAPAGSPSEALPATPAGSGDAATVAPQAPAASHSAAVQQSSRRRAPGRRGGPGPGQGDAVAIMVPVASIRIVEGFNARNLPDTDESEEGLTASMARDGLLQPIVVVPSEGGEDYELVSGERRLRGARALGWEQIAVTVRERGTDLDRKL